jgi:hypothetical protein
MNILLKLQTEWPAHYALQPKTADERKVVIEIQALKKEAAKEIERLRSGYKILRDCSDSEMGDGDLAREIANKMLGT